MKRQDRQAFTLVELLVVIAIIGILIGLLLPAVQAARESVRRASCSNNLAQLIIGIHHYEAAFRHYPAGTIEKQGPIQNVNIGYHHGWLTALLPYIEQRTTYRYIDRSVGVYDPRNAPVRDINIMPLQCPSSRAGSKGRSHYAANHHDVEAPIDSSNNGVFFLNSQVRYLEISDGASQTLFLGEKLPDVADLGWISGTRATLRNTGTPINEVFSYTSTWRTLGGPPSQNGQGYSANGDLGMMMGMASDNGFGAPPAAPESAAAASADPNALPQTGPANDPANADPANADASKQPPLPPIYDGRPTTATAVGGYESDHTGGANFSFGDGSVKFLSDSIDRLVYQQLGHRADGKLLSQDF